MYRPSISSRERIEVFGDYGAGKTSAVLSIAAHLPESHFYVLDNDYAMERMLSGKYADLTNLTVYQVSEWGEHVEAIQKAIALMSPDDWLVIDSVSETWEAVQDWWIENTQGKDPADYFMQLQKDRVAEGKGSGGGISQAEWGGVKKEYKRKLTQPAILRCPGHLIVTARAARFTGDENKELLSFAPLGAYPKGEKYTPYLMHTVLMLGKTRSGGYTMTTGLGKDRERAVLKDQQFDDFFMTYLVGIGKWRPVKSED